MPDAVVFPIAVADASRIPAATVFRMWDAGAFPTRVADAWGIPGAAAMGTQVVVAAGVTGMPDARKCYRGGRVGE